MGCNGFYFISDYEIKGILKGFFGIRVQSEYEAGVNHNSMGMD